MRATPGDSTVDFEIILVEEVILVPEVLLRGRNGTDVEFIPAECWVVGWNSYVAAPSFHSVPAHVNVEAIGATIVEIGFIPEFIYHSPRSFKLRPRSFIRMVASRGFGDCLSMGLA